MINGICTQVANGAACPTDMQLKMLGSVETVRDVWGWHRLEQTKGVYSEPAPLHELRAVAADHRIAVIMVAGFGNDLYGGKDMSFPVEIDTKGKIVRDSSAQFAAAYAWAANVLRPYAIEIYNEVNGSSDDGSPPVRQEEYAMLCEQVVPAIRAANPDVKIIGGASVGFNVDGWFINLNKLFKLDQFDALAFHPYVGKPNLPTWAKQMARIRAAGIKTPAWYTEHGGKIAAQMGAEYWPFFKSICAADPVPVMGHNYFLLQSRPPKFNSGLFGADGIITPIGVGFP